MVGSTFLYIPDEDAIDGLDWSDFDAWADFEQVEMDALMTLDFTVLLNGTDLRWGAGEPTYLNEAAGMVVMKIQPFCLATVLRKSDALDPEYQADFERLREFLQAHGLNEIYEVSTF